MWYKIDPNGLKYNELLQLYKVVDDRERGFREDLFRFTNFYSAVCIAVLGVTLSGLASLYGKGVPLLMLIIGPVITILMCMLGLRVTGQIYRRIQDETSTKAKLENLLGLDGALPITEFLGKETIWQEDISVLPTRHAKRRFEEKNSDQFVKKGSSKKGGVNTNNKIYFGIIALFAVLVIIAIVVMSFLQGKA